MWIIRLNKTKTQFPVGVDCIFHLRGTPYSRWTFPMLFFFLFEKKRQSLEAWLRITQSQEFLPPQGLEDHIIFSNYGWYLGL